MASAPAMAGCTTPLVTTPRRAVTSLDGRGGGSAAPERMTPTTTGSTAGPSKAPTAKSTRQPVQETHRYDRQVAMMPPAGMPPMTREMHSGPRRRPLADLAIAMQIGITTPRAVPATSRAAPNQPAFGARPAASMAPEKTRIPQRSTRSCVSRAASRPTVRPPTSMPQNTAEPTRPAAPVVMPSPRSAVRRGRTLP